MPRVVEYEDVRPSYYVYFLRGSDCDIDHRLVFPIYRVLQ